MTVARDQAAREVWFPYTQMKKMRSPMRVVAAQGCELELDDGRRLVDAISSWWCVIHGYNHPRITAAAQRQAELLPHVMLGGLIHPSAEQLAIRLTKVTPPGLNHVFFGDSGSVGVEIAIKMAVQFWANQVRPEKRRMLALLKAYHGDTCGAMSVCDPVEGMHHLFAGVLPRQVFAPAPSPGFDAPAEVVARDIAALESLLAEHAHELAGFIVEPILQAAGGFNIYSPEYLRQAAALCERYEVLFIFDEIATGFGRTGRFLAAEHAGVTPDIMILGKGLTAGYAGHSATLATSRVYDAFLDDDAGRAFMHGPTYMGNPTACAIALAGLDVFFEEDYLTRIAAIEARLCDRLLGLTGPHVAGTRVLGATGVVEAATPEALNGLQDYAARRGVWLRPFDRYAYAMPPYVITDAQLDRILDVLVDWFAGPSRPGV